MNIRHILLLSCYTIISFTMFFWLFLLFTAVPLLELYLLIEIGKVIGIMPTVGIVFLTGIVGAAMAKREGRNTLNKIRHQLGQGKIPSDELQDGIIILVSGALLITPGILTDIVGFAGLFPWTRNLEKWMVKKWFKRMVDRGSMHYDVKMDFGPHPGDTSPEDQTADMEYDLDVEPKRDSDSETEEETREIPN